MLAISIRSAALVATLALVLQHGSARAAQPLSDVDPLLPKGFLPGSAASHRGEAAHALTAAKLATAERRCRDVAIAKLFAGKPTSLADCLASAHARYEKSVAGIEPPRKVLPGCVDVAAEQGFAGRFGRGSDADRYCAGTASLSDGDPLLGAGFVPPDRATLAGEAVVTRALDKLFLALRKCHDAAVRAAVKGTSYPLAGCIGAANDKYAVALAAIAPPRKSIPECLDPIAEQAYVNGLAQNDDGFWYCD